MSGRLRRREFLLSTGAGVGLATLLGRLEGHAEGQTAPKRLLIIHRGVGPPRGTWLPDGSSTQIGVDGGTEPFGPLLDDLIVIDDLNIICGNSGQGTHEGHMVALATGQPTLGKDGQQDHIAGSRSIEQLFLERSPDLGGTPFGSLQLGADSRSDRNEVSPRVLSYLAPASPGGRAQPLFPDLRPMEVYDRIFDSMVVSERLSPEEREALLARRGSMLDFMRDDLRRLRQLVPSEQRVKVDAHESSLESLETALRASTEARTCVVPERPMQYPDNPNQFGDRLGHREVGRAMLEIVRAAFACDLARVATFLWSPGTNHVTFGDLYDGMGAVRHHPISHSATRMPELIAIDRWYCRETTEALLAFKNTPDIDGSSLLDNTVVVFQTEVSNSINHDWRRVPTAVLGGKNLGLGGGRLLSYSEPRPFNDLWLALAPKFGVELPSLGDDSMWSGPLPDL